MIYLHFKWGGGYSKSEVDTLLNGKANSSHTHTKSEITDFPTLSTVATSGSYNDLSNKPTIPIVDSALSSTSTNALQNKAINTELSKKANTSHTHTVSDVTDFPTLATVATSGSYNDLSNKPTTMTPASHTHGNITNDGKIGSNANKPLITTTGGTVTTGSFGTSANTFCEGNDSRLSDARTPTSHTHVKSEITDFPSLATVATSGSYNDLSNKPTIPTVNNATLTIQKNGTDVKTFTANASSDVTCNITVPTKVSELTNDSGFLTSHQSLSNYSTLSNTVKSLSISGKTITVTPGSGNAYTLTTQDTTYTHPTSSGNKHIPSGGSSGQFLGWSADGTAKWVNNPNTNTWTAMVGATSSSNGSVGYVNAVPPKDGYNTKYLRADGTWQVPPDHTYTVNNATLTIQKNGTNVNTFTANASSNVTCNITVPTKTSDLTNDSGFLTSADLLPIGSYIQFAGSQAPAGFLVCNGGAISRTTYSALFAVIGTTYGSGDGSTTFNLPNLTDRFLQGSTTSGTVKNAGLPNITGYFGHTHAGSFSGCFKKRSSSSDPYIGHVAYNGAFFYVDFDASKSSSIYGNSSTVQPPALTCLICIKY